MSVSEKEIKKETSRIPISKGKQPYYTRSVAAADKMNNMSEPAKSICEISADGNPKEIKGVQEPSEISGEESGAAGLIESSSIDENTITLKDLVELLANKIGADERNNSCSITAESFAKIIPEFDGESIPVKNWFANFELNAAAYGVNIKQMYVQARAKMTNTAKLFLDSTYVHEYSEMRMLLET